MLQKFSQKSHPKIFNRVGKKINITMKKQNAKNKLAFNKAVVSQLNNESMKEIQGGTGNNVMPTYDDQTNVISGCTPIFDPFNPNPIKGFQIGG